MYIFVYDYKISVKHNYLGLLKNYSWISMTEIQILAIVEDRILK